MKQIYIWTNLVNGKQYVGQTNDIKNRKRQFKCTKKYYANDYLDNDRKLYDYSNWELSVLKECDDSEADEWERYYINEFNTKHPSGYNITDGGIGGYKMPNEVLEKLRNSHLGQKPTEKQLSNLRSIAEKKRKKIEKINHDGTIEEYDSICEAVKQGFHKGNLIQCLNGKRKTCGGFKWKYKYEG